MNNPISSCIFIKKSHTEFEIIFVYVDNLNLIGTFEKFIKTIKYLKNEFEMEVFGKTKFCFGLQIEQFLTRVLVHQSTYIKKILKRFNMDKTYLLSSPMVVQPLDMKIFVIVKRTKFYLVLKYNILVLLMYVLMYLANCIVQILFFLSIY